MVNYIYYFTDNEFYNNNSIIWFSEVQTVQGYFSLIYSTPRAHARSYETDTDHLVPET